MKKVRETGDDRSDRPSQRRPDSPYAATLIVVAAGSLLHFAYGWSGAWAPAALFAAVNESVWEHLKIAFWPALILALVRARPGAGLACWAAQGVGLLVPSVVIVAVFYGYTAILGDNLLVADIATFALAILLGQIASRRLARRGGADAGLRALGLALLVAQLGAFSAFTYAAPRLFLFEDPRNGRYGLEAYEHPRPRDGGSARPGAPAEPSAGVARVGRETVIGDGRRF